MEDWTSRTQLLIGKAGMERLRQAHVLVAGLGGVGSYLAEALCRAGIGKLTIFDGDIIKPSNINRQLPALTSTIGQSKTSVMASRLININPNLQLGAINQYLKDEALHEIICQPYDYVADAIDTLSPKIFLLSDAVRYGHRVVSSMGAGGRMNPEKIRVADISETHTCPLAFLLRKRLRKHGIYTGFKAVFSEEPVMKGSQIYVENEPNKRTTVGTVSYMPALFGLYMASVILRDLVRDALYTEAEENY
ncbi:MAG: tRNA threonylcarbamoyladenosine dehydratase [Bacteroidales bacterium]